MTRSGNSDRMLAALNVANDAILRAPSEEALFRHVCEAMVVGDQVIGAVLFLISPDGQLQPAASAGLGGDLTRGPMTSVDGNSNACHALATTAFRKGRLVAVAGHRSGRKDTKRPADLQPHAAIPFEKGKAAQGVLLLVLDPRCALDEAAMKLLERLAGNISFALDKFDREKHAREAERTSERVARMFAVLSATNEAIMRATTRQELCQMACDAAMLGGAFASTALALAEPDSDLVRFVAAAGPAAEGAMRLQSSRSSDAQTLIARVFKTKQASVSNDCQNDPKLKMSQELQMVFKKANLNSAAAWPLLKQGEPIGALVLSSNERDVFTPDIVEMFRRLADNVSFGLDNFDRADEKTRADEQVQYLATHDGLTGLPNRIMFSQLLNRSIEMSHRHGRKFALLFIDLDRFKIINDTLGHAEGDALLIETSKRLRESVRASDVVARLGGDEFVVILEEVANNGEVECIAEKLLSAVMKPLLLRNQECRVTASIGVSVYPTDGADEQTLTKNADIAMYRAKDEGKNAFRIYSKGMKTPSIERLMLETGLRHALERDEFVLHYQPKRDLVSGKITGVEALLRWLHPDLGLLQPNQFIPLAEETGLIVPIGKWVMVTACKQNMEWQRQGLPAMSIAVNLSPRQFTHEFLLNDIDEALAESRMPAELLELEITEGVVMQNVERAIEVLGAIKSRGVQLAMDDFGTGYSSMSLIKQFPVDTLKIDRSFIRDLVQNTEDKAIADAIISLGKALGLTVIAEGVETTEQEQFLQDHACDQMQGFLCGKPMPAEELPALLRLPVHAAPSLQYGGPAADDAQIPKSKTRVKSDVR